MIAATSTDSRLRTIPPPESSERRVYVVDDNSDVRRSLHFSLTAAGIATRPFRSAQDFLDEVLALQPGPILLDVRMPGTSGIEMLAILRERGIHWPVIMMSAHGDIPMAVRSIRLGAVDFLEKPFNLDDLEALLFEAFTHLVEVMQTAWDRRAARAAWEQLTAREAQVVDLLITGVANKAVAHELGISVRTVEIHRGRALLKLKLKSLAQISRLRLLVS